MSHPWIVPGAEPFLFPGGPVGCLLIHGFTASPEEMKWLGDDLAQRGHTVLGIRLAGHGTHPDDLRCTRWHDWMVSLEEGLALLSGLTERVFVLGLSMGGVVALNAAALYPMAGAVVMSTPYGGFSKRVTLASRLLQIVRPMVRKGVTEHKTLGKRREADYPAYAALPMRIIPESAKLQAAMQAALPKVTVPVLLIHSRADTAVSAADVKQLHDKLGAAEKEVLLLDGFDHALVRDPKREKLFEAIGSFIDRVAAATQSEE